MSHTSPPVPLVPRFAHGARKLRKGRGFSLAEIKKAGILKSDARSMGIRVDERRFTLHPQNVATLTAFLAPPKQETIAPKSVRETPAVALETEKVAQRPRKKPKRSAKPAKKRKR